MSEETAPYGSGATAAASSAADSLRPTMPAAPMMRMCIATPRLAARTLVTARALARSAGCYANGPSSSMGTVRPLWALLNAASPVITDMAPARDPARWPSGSAPSWKIMLRMRSSPP